MIIGINENALLKANLTIETNHIKFTVEKGILDKINQIIDSFNIVSWEDKSRDLLNLEDGEIEESIREKIKQYILEKADLSQYSFEDFVFSNEDMNNIRNYEGESIDVIDNLKYFVGKILPIEVIEMIKVFEAGIKEINLEGKPLNSFVSGVKEYVVYMGPNEKYRGCIGKVVRQRDNDTATELVEFPNKFRESGRIARFWSKPENLVKLDEVGIKSDEN